RPGAGRALRRGRRQAVRRSVPGDARARGAPRGAGADGVRRTAAAELGGEDHGDAAHRRRRAADQGSVTDFRRFLGKAEAAVAPVVAGRAYLADRQVRSDAGDGWWRVTVRGRTAEATATAELDEVAAALA